MITARLMFLLLSPLNGYPEAMQIDSAHSPCHSIFGHLADVAIMSVL